MESLTILRPVPHRFVVIHMSNIDTTFGTVRRYSFYGAVVLAIGVPVALIQEPLVYLVTGWTGFLGSHSVHDLVIFAVVWMGLLGLAVQFIRPLERVNAILAMPVVMIPAAVIGFATGTDLAMMGVILGGLGLLALVLHPAGRSLLTFDRLASPNRLLVGLFAVGALVMVAYGGLELVKQFTVTDEHAVIQHYGNTALAAFYVAFMGALAVFRRPDWRFAAWSAGFIALYLGASSMVFPSVESSLGMIGGLLVVVWALAFVVLVERERGDIIGGPRVAEESTTRPT